MDAFTRLFGDLKPEACRAIIHVIDVTLQACPFEMLKESIISTGLLGKLLNTILSANEVIIFFFLFCFIACIINMLLIDFMNDLNFLQQENPYVLVSYVLILSRIIINV